MSHTLRADRRAALDELHASAERYQQTVLESFGQVADILDALSQDARTLAAQSRALAVAQQYLDTTQLFLALGGGAPE
jgi:outer membrane protein TolC